MPGTLFVVATPIGNLEDVTFRAIRVLREAGLIAAEDTRRTATLLMRHGIRTPTTSLHEHNERQKIPQLLDKLASGVHVAVVSDAGTPGISDPGFRLVRAAVELGVRIEAVPGPSAVITALVASGFPTNSFTFLGFPPSRGLERQRWLTALVTEPRTCIFFEAPHRIRATLEALQSGLGNRQVAIARELTKIHEEILRGTISDIVGHLTNPKGEITVVVAPETDEVEPARPIPDDEVLVTFTQVIESEGIMTPSSVRRKSA
jgi:16S rRNA (cytidine1402-2'-O)-methyltransferase